MKISISLGGALSELSLAEQVAYVVEAERMGVDSVWTVEGWGRDAVTPLAYLAAKTHRIKLGTSIMQISARVFAMTAMTALTLAALSENRFILGLGVSGPQIVEGLHGTSYGMPLTRLKETVEVIRLAFAGEKLAYSGNYHRLPLPDGLGRAIRLSEPANPRIPIYLATLGRRSLAYTGAEADGWIGTSFVPETGDALLSDIRRGAEQVDRSLDDFAVVVGAAAVAFDEDLDALVESERMGRAFTLGAMGSADQNFYKDAYARAGWEEEANEVQSLWLAGKRVEAAARVPRELILQTNLFGDEAGVRSRLQAYREAGVTTLKVQPKGGSIAERLETLGQLMDLV
jgi:F420-dependent oxidoreductase-like protein